MPEILQGIFAALLCFFIGRFIIAEATIFVPETEKVVHAVDQFAESITHDKWLLDKEAEAKVGDESPLERFGEEECKPVKRQPFSKEFKYAFNSSQYFLLPDIMSFHAKAFFGGQSGECE